MVMINSNSEEWLLLGGREVQLWRTWGDQAIWGNVLFFKLHVGYTVRHYTTIQPFCVPEVFLSIV